MAKLNLEDLKKAVTPATQPSDIKIPKPDNKRMKRVLSARLVASEYLRNGLNLAKAYESVTHKKYTTARFNAMMSNDTAFMEEINVALTAADVEKNKVLALLWAMANVSPLDFMDDDGATLSIAELKKLPREVRAIIEEVNVTTIYKTVLDENGKAMKDKDGKPLLKPEQHVKIKVANKQAAIATIAQIGKLIGPTTLTQNNYIVSIGQSMADADARRLEILRARGNEIQGEVKVISEHPSKS